MKKVKVTSKGQITLPQNMRDKLNIKEGDYLDIIINKDAFLLRPSPKDNNLEVIMEYCNKYSTGKVSLEETREVLRKVPFSLSEKTSKLREEKDEE